MNIVALAQMVHMHPGMSANALARLAGVRITHRGQSMAWYADVKAACVAGAIVGRDGKAAFGVVSTVYYTY